jgi:serine/threonine-protein kinase
MDDNLWRRARDIFEQAIEMEESRRTAFLREACGADQSMMAEVKKMIAADQRHNSMLDRPIFQWGVTAETTIDRVAGAMPFNYIGNYRLIRKLGEGGMGEVYLAIEEPVNRKVAIKLMLAGLDAEYLRRFHDERKTLARLNHRNIVTMYASGEVNGRPYFVMEYLDGEPLRAKMRRGLLTLPEIVEITGQICDALNAAHNQGIVHRDIKPENIFISRDTDGLLVKVLDFGISTLKESETGTITGAVIGTAAYLSPEQVMGLNRKEIDGRADIYTLGVMVYEMLTGVLPFTATDRNLYFQLHLNTTPRPPSERASRFGITEAVDNVVMKALAKNRNERHQTAREFARELKEAVENPLPAPAPGPVESPSPKRAFRYRKVLPPAILLLLLGAGGWLTFRFFYTSTNTEANLPLTASPSRAPLSAPAQAPGLTVQIERKGIGLVSSEASFRKGDAVRLIASPNRSGRLYIVMRGTTGPAEILYPDSRISGSGGVVQADQLINMPPKNKWFEFDSRPGVETLYIVFAAQNGDERLRSLESAVLEKRLQLSKAEEEQTLSALEALIAGQSASTTVTAKKIQLNHGK